MLIILCFFNEYSDGKYSLDVATDMLIWIPTAVINSVLISIVKVV